MSRFWIKNFLIFSACFILGVIFLIPDSFGAQSLVRIEGQQLLVQKRLGDGSLDAERSFTIKMINWSPAAVGDTFGSNFLDHYLSDIPLIKKMNVNTVRIYGPYDFSNGSTDELISHEVLDELYSNGIMVIIDIVTDWRINSLSEIEGVVEHVMNHPAVLMLSLGNEWNWNYYYGGTSGLEDAILATQTAAGWIKDIYNDAGLTPVPVMSNLVYWWDEPNSDWKPFDYYESIVNQCPAVDAWGFNMYQEPGKYFQFLNQWLESGITQPIFIAEFGADSNWGLSGQEDQAYQSYFDALMWSTARQHPLLGAGIFEFNDEWWKCSTGDPWSQDTGGYSDPDLKDGYRSEEYLGVVDIGRSPKEAYYKLKQLYPLKDYLDIGGEIELKVESATIASSPNYSYTRFYVNGQKYWNALIFDPNEPSELWAPGMNILVLDAQSLTTLDLKNFDLNENPSVGEPEEEAMRDFLANNIPNDSLVMLGASDTLTAITGVNFQTATIDFFHSIGSTLIDLVGYKEPYTFIFKKDAAGNFSAIAENVGYLHTAIVGAGAVNIDNNFKINCDIDSTITAQSETLTAAAAIETELRYTQQATGYGIPSQLDLYDYAKAHNQTVNQASDFVDADGFLACIRANQLPFYNFKVISLDTAQGVIDQITLAMSEPVPDAGPVFCPAFIIARGDDPENCYHEWIMIRGVHTDINPQNGAFVVKGFWLRDYSAQDAVDIYVTNAEFVTNYFKALNTPNAGDAYEAKFVAIVPTAQEGNYSLDMQAWFTETGTNTVTVHRGNPILMQAEFTNTGPEATFRFYCDVFTSSGTQTTAHKEDIQTLSNGQSFSYPNICWGTTTHTRLDTYTFKVKAQVLTSTGETIPLDGEVLLYATLID